MRMRLRPYSFLPRVRDGGTSHYPYLTDEAMRNLRWVARSYANVLPVCVPDPGMLVKGDKVRITEGEFKDAVATVVTRPGSGQKDIMVCVENWILVPLLRVQPGQYEIISLDDSCMHVYTRLNNDCLSKKLHEALHRYHTASLTAEDRALATEPLRQYGNLQMASHVTRCNLNSLLLPAHTILGNRLACETLLSTIQAILPIVKAEQSRALLLVTLYGCTDSSIYHGMAHDAVAPWRKEIHPKKAKSQLIRRLDDYDIWLGQSC